MTAGEFTEQPKTYLKLEKVVIKEKPGKLLKTASTWMKFLQEKSLVGMMTERNLPRLTTAIS